MCVPRKMQTKAKRAMLGELEPQISIRLSPPINRCATKTIKVKVGQRNPFKTPPQAWPKEDDQRSPYHAKKHVAQGC